MRNDPLTLGGDCKNASELSVIILLDSIGRKPTKIVEKLMIYSIRYDSVFNASIARYRVPLASNRTVEIRPQSHILGTHLSNLSHLFLLWVVHLSHFPPRALFSQFASAQL